MTVVTFLPSKSARYFERVLSHERILCANSWNQFELFAREQDCAALVFDPMADGHANVKAALHVMGSHPRVPTIAYIALEPPNLRAIATLSRFGLPATILHPFEKGQAHFWELVDRVSGTLLAQEFFSYLESSFPIIPIGLRWAVQDLLARPQRYSCGADLAIQSGLSERTVWRFMKLANLGTPRKLVVAAKVLHGYAFLRCGRAEVESVSRRLGYGHPRIFEENAVRIFGCTPSRLRLDSDPTEVARHVLDWLYKPSVDGTSCSCARGKRHPKPNRELRPNAAPVGPDSAPPNVSALAE